MRDTNNDANLIGGNIKGELFWCVHKHNYNNAPTRIVILCIYKEYDIVDNSVKFLISMLYNKHIIPFYYK